MLNQSRPETAIPRKEPGKGTLPRLRAKRNPAPHAHETTRRGGCREPSAKLHEFGTRSTDMARERDPARRNPFSYEDISIFVETGVVRMNEFTRRPAAGLGANLEAVQDLLGPVRIITQVSQDLVVLIKDEDEPIVVDRHAMGLEPVDRARDLAPVVMAFVAILALANDRSFFAAFVARVHERARRARCRDRQRRGACLLGKSASMHGASPWSVSCQLSVASCQLS